MKRIFLTAILVAGCCAQSDGEQHLHPMCDDNIFRPSELGADGVTQMAMVSGESLAINCFSFAFLPSTSTNPASPPPCTATDLSKGRAVLDIVDPNTPSGANDHSVDLGVLYAGSMYASRFAFSSSRTFKYLLIFPPHQNCTARVEATTYSTYTPVLRRQVNNLPYVVVANPLVMFRNDPYTITFDAPEPLTDAELGQIGLMALPSTKRCEFDARREFNSGEWNAPVRVNSTRFTWTLTVPKPRELFVCIRGPYAFGRFSTAAIIEAYGANPAFFTLDTVTSTRSLVTYELLFEGHALDSSADVVRLVDANQHFCGSDSLPSQYASVGAVTTFNADATMVRVSVQVNRLFLVCYYHASAREWVRVPNFDSLSRDALTNTSDPDQQRINHDNAPGDGKAGISECASAPLLPPSGTIQNDNVVLLTISRAPMPASFPQSVATLLCLPSPDYLVIYDTLRVETNGGARTELTIGIDCNPSVCANDERMRALVANANKLSGFVSVELETFSGLASRRGSGGGDDDDDGKSKKVIAAVVIVAVCIIAGLVFAVVYLTRRRREAERRAAIAEEEAADAGPVVGTVVNVRSAAEGQDAAGRSRPYPEPTEMRAAPAHRAESEVTPPEGATAKASAPLPPPRPPHRQNDTVEASAVEDRREEPDGE